MIGLIESSKTIISTGEQVNITCTSKCAWNWHQFYINSNHVMDNDYNTDSYSISDITNTIMNCPTCSQLRELNCSDPIQGPVVSVMNMTFSSSGDYYVQCITYLFNLNSLFWPNKIFKVYSDTLKIKVIDEQQGMQTCIGLANTITFTSSMQGMCTLTLQECVTCLCVCMSVCGYVI